VKEEKTTWERAQIINIGLQRIEEREPHPTMDRKERTIGYNATGEREKERTLSLYHGP